MFDVVIKNGLVLDGAGAPGYNADIGVRGDRIVAIGEVSGEATQVIDASGSVVTPGFIDLHAHSDLSFLIDPQADKDRVQKPQWLVMVGICTHLGCIPLGQKANDPKGEYGPSS